MFILLTRIIKSGWADFKRHSGLSVATIFILVLAISVATSLFLFQKISHVLSDTIAEKVNMYVYFNTELSSDEIMQIQGELVDIPEIRRLEYVSSDEALKRFVERHKDDRAIMESLGELGENPLFASISIQAWEASQYAAISNFLNNSPFSNLIAKIDYQQKESVIEKLNSAASGVSRAGFIVSIVLALIAVLVAFNTVKLAIFSSHEEIETMRLVGASNGFIRGPFLVQGAMVGFSAALITLFITGISLFFLSPTLKVILSGFNIFHYFIGNILLIFFIQLSAGVGLGIISSWLAIRKYLRV